MLPTNFKVERNQPPIIFRPFGKETAYTFSDTGLIEIHREITIVELLLHI